MVVGYGHNEGVVEERDRFWNDIERILYCVGNGYRLCMLRNLNGWIGYETRAGITGALEFQEKTIMAEE